MRGVWRHMRCGGRGVCMSGVEAYVCEGCGGTCVRGVWRHMSVREVWR